MRQGRFSEGVCTAAGIGGGALELHAQVDRKKFGLQMVGPKSDRTEEKDGVKNFFQSAKTTKQG